MSGAPFSRRALTLLISLMGISFLSGVVFMIFGREITAPPSWGADSYSRSALGFHGFFELLEDGDVPVLRRRRAINDADVVALLAPRDGAQLDTTFSNAVTQAVRGASDVLVVLPKWSGHRHPVKEGWVSERYEVGADAAKEVLDILDIGGSVVRLGDGATPTFRSNELPCERLRLDSPQLVKSEKLEPLVWTDEGTLVGIHDWFRRRVIVVSDPDIFNNWGLGRGENATLAWSIVDRLRERDDAAVVVDERIHGHQAEGTLASQLFKFPLVVLTAHVLAFLALVLWATTGRFGKTIPAPAPLGSGKRMLIENTARLLRQGGHSAYSLKRYFHAAARRVAAALHVSQEAERGDVLARLQKLSVSRGATDDPVELAHAVTDAKDSKNEHHVMELAQRVHRWRGEMIDGTGRNP